MLAAISDVISGSAALFVALAFAVILMVSRSNSPDRYREQERAMTRREEYYRYEKPKRHNNDRYEYDDPRSQDRVAGGGFFAAFIFAFGLLCFHVFNFVAVGTFLMVIGGLAVVAFLLTALRRNKAQEA